MEEEKIEERMVGFRWGRYGVRAVELRCGIAFLLAVVVVRIPVMAVIKD